MLGISTSVPSARLRVRRVKKAQGLALAAGDLVGVQSLHNGWSYGAKMTPGASVSELTQSFRAHARGWFGLKIQGARDWWFLFESPF